MNDSVLKQTFSALRRKVPNAKPVCGLILGSGLGDVASAFNMRKCIPYSGFGNPLQSRIPGHAGNLIWGNLAGIETFVFCGRHHLYEGIGWEPIAAPIYLLKRFGASIVILTNAAGGISGSLKTGDIMLVDDHINAMGTNPLIGNNDSTWGSRFVDQSRVYDSTLGRLLIRAAARAGQRLQQGVYVAVSGPTYETPAEIGAYRRMGADAIGMSTVPEAILAHAAGIRVAALSGITNTTNRGRPSPAVHENVVNAARQIVPAMKALITSLWKDLARSL